MQATIIAVGSELLCGQITNRNAAWISARLFANGIGTTRHVTVDDVESDIVAALREAEVGSDLIFVTGGLGPTSDDLTRHAVARWAAQELVWHEASWTRIQELFRNLARTTPESNRQQCWFPRDATVLVNGAGTANAFALQVRGKRAWVLPGPPKEVDAVWTPHVQPAVENLIPPAERAIYKMWRTIGRGESHVAEEIERLIAGQGVEVAYRAHPPYVETKLRFAAKDLAAHRALCDRIQAALQPWLFEVDDEDSAQSFVALIAARGKRTRIVDAITRGNLVEMLSPLWRATAGGDLAMTAEFGLGAAARPEGDELVLSVGPGRSPETWLAAATTAKASAEAEYPLAYKGDANRVRNEKAVALLALKRWPELLARLAPS